jgi:hypothetical protein
VGEASTTGAAQRSRWAGSQFTAVTHQRSPGTTRLVCWSAAPAREAWDYVGDRTGLCSGFLRSIPSTRLEEMRQRLASVGGVQTAGTPANVSAAFRRTVAACVSPGEFAAYIVPFETPVQRFMACDR